MEAATSRREPQQEPIREMEITGAASLAFTRPLSVKHVFVPHSKIHERQNILFIFILHTSLNDYVSVLKSFPISI